MKSAPQCIIPMVKIFKKILGRAPSSFPTQLGTKPLIGWVSPKLMSPPPLAVHFKHWVLAFNIVLQSTTALLVQDIVLGGSVSSPNVMCVLARQLQKPHQLIFNE